MIAVECSTGYGAYLMYTEASAQRVHVEVITGTTVVTHHSVQSDIRSIRLVKPTDIRFPPVSSRTGDL